MRAARHGLLAGWLLAFLFLSNASSALAQAVYIIEGVAADVTAEDAVTAREQAIDQAQRDGLRQLFGQLAPDTAPERLPGADGDVNRFVRSFEIASEQVGAQRYVGQLNVTYDGDQVRSALRQAGITPPAPPVPTLIVPAVATATGTGLWWEAENWKNALAAAISIRPGSPYLLPLGDAIDVSTLTPATLDGGDPAAAGALAQRYAAEAVVLALLSEGDGQSAQVELRPLHENAAPPTEVTVPGSGDGALAQAAEATLAAVTSAARAPPREGPVETVRIGIPLSDLAQWVQVRRDLRDTRAIRDVRIDSFARSRAEVTLRFTGGLPQLQESMSQRGLDLSSENGEWQLLPAVGPRPQAY